MKRKEIWLIAVLLIPFVSSCIKDNFWYSGVSNGRHDCSLLEYMESDSYNWDSTVLMVRHAGEELIQIFEGNDPDLQEITFFGPTNHSIRRYMLENGIEKISDMDPEWCANT